jgi:hypothetical protein
MTSCAYVSLGPACISAEILKSSDLRTSTLGFDWCRSGAIHLSEFLLCSHETFMERHVYYPNIMLKPTARVVPGNLPTYEIDRLPNKYGFDYLFNPHRDLSLPTTREYLSRAFKRLREVIYNRDVFKILLLTDYINKPFHNFMPEPFLAADFIGDLLASHGITNTYLVVLRMELSSIKTQDLNIVVKRNSATHVILRAVYPEFLDDPQYRHYIYRIIGKRALVPLSDGKTLWRPAV